MSTDPMADSPQNMSTSPYAYVWNNPMRFIDPTGMHGESVDDIIVDGVTYNVGDTGSGQSTFVQETFAALNQIASDKDSNGNDTNTSKLVKNLAASIDHTVNITQTTGNTHASVGLGVMQGKDIVLGNQSLLFNPTQGIENIGTGDSFSPDVALVHELGHIQNAIDSPSDFLLRSNTPNVLYDDFEEAKTMIDYEIPYAKNRNMLVRTYRTYSSPGVIGNRPKTTSNSITN